jgi:GxxExxY protein
MVLLSPQGHADTEKNRTQKGGNLTMKPKRELLEERLSGEVIGASIEVHRQLGPGLLESSYEFSLARELELRGISYEFQKPLPLEYKGIRLDCGYRLDLLVSRAVVVEVKSVAALAPIHEAQLLTYLKLTGVRVGLLINFNVVVLKDGLRRLVH